MKRLCYVLLVLLPLHSCVEEVDTAGLSYFENCDSSNFTVQESQECQPEISDPQAPFCEYQPLGNQDLLERSRGSLKYMCSKIGALVYENPDGATWQFNISRKVIRYAVQWNQPCESGELEVLYCAERETAIASLKDWGSSLTFACELGVQEREIEGSGDDLDYVNIGITMDDSGSFRSILYYLTDKFGSKQMKTENLTKVSVLSLNDKIYNEVYITEVIDNFRIKSIIYNQDFGILGFTDLQGTLWALKGFK